MGFANCSLAVCPHKGHLWRTRVLGQSWEEASDALILEPDERTTFLRRMRRAADFEMDDEDGLDDAADHIDQHLDNT